MASIVDVAREAGVSVATVSRILNRERNVSLDTARSVEEAIQKLDYVARAVRPGPKPKNRMGVHTGTITFLSVSDFSPEKMYSMAAFPSLLGGIQKGCARHGINLVLAHSPGGRSVPPVLVRKQADGVLLVGDAAVSASLKQTLKRLPVVWCFRSRTDSAGMFDHVFYDNSKIGQMAADYLIARGRRRIAFACLSPDHPAAVERRNGFLEAAAAKKVRASAVEAVKEVENENPARTVGRLLDRIAGLSPRPDGIFFFGDDLMLAAFNGLRNRGIEPQRDVDLIGCNNDKQFMNQMHPRPATIDIKLDLLGERAVEQLLWRMAHPEDDSRMEILIKPALVHGEDVPLS